MTKPTTPGIAELLDAYRSACIQGAWEGDGEAKAHAAVLSYVTDLEAQRDEALKDAGRIDFLESLMKRTGRFGYKNTELSLATDMHIGSTGMAIYARTGIGSAYEFSGHGSTVREAIDQAIAQRGGKDA